MSKYKRYLGDGLYADYDGYHVKLYTQENQMVFLEPYVMLALLDYNKNLREKLIKDCRENNDG